MTTASERAGAYWFLQGMRGIFSLPALILITSFVGFTGFASEAGLLLEHAVFMTGIVWALPAMVLLISSILANASLPAAFLTVTLSSIRLLPMVAALIPEIRGRKTSIWVLLFASHFIAVTAWVFTMERIRSVPVDQRLRFFLGFALTLTTTVTAVVAAVFVFVEKLPPIVAGTLFFLTPIYFLTSIWASARDRIAHYAMIAGLLGAPLFHLIAPDFDILYTGIVAGTLAFAFDRLVGRRRKPAADAEETGQGTGAAADEGRDR
ncbi:AzlC family ABC transporter permease [Pseudohoeflea coraliihabitans]|uniref:AzlC family ABC transporter permease n=1 Tax=Pseudohoeflea coraliihabitans TaxID=2860393 RepID=A0ABS6WRC5_9HYPH|nr:AzlC family ABC transporter permease [Pseudohoeflea sp. DP4N28-3]MBW3098509.1 AzlC family ABC transporter permease [Pseudohoeflea sp. DP4N28-3]